MNPNARFQRALLRLAHAALLGLTVLGCPLPAETGMALVLDVHGGGDKLWDAGDIIRIDMKDDKIVKQTGYLAWGYGPRFSADGSRFAYIKGGKLYICDLDGATLAEASHGMSNGDNAGVSVSYTPGGLYVWGDKQIKVYNESALLVRTIGLSAGVRGYVDHAGRWGVSKDDRLVDIQNNKVMWTGNGCSYGISPNGKLFTQNLWESGKEHETMKIYNNNDGSVSQRSYLSIHTTLGLGSGWIWNEQRRSGHSDDIWIVAVGKEKDNQIYYNIDPYVHNLSTNKYYNLAGSKSGSVYWRIFDYYTGKIPGGTVTPTVATPTISPGGGHRVDGRPGGGAGEPRDTTVANMNTIIPWFRLYRFRRGSDHGAWWRGEYLFRREDGPAHRDALHKLE